MTPDSRPDDIPCERFIAHDPHEHTVDLEDFRDGEVQVHCPGRSANDPPAPSRTIDKHCGATGNHPTHSMRPVFSPTTTFRCDGRDPKTADPAYRAMLAGQQPDPWEGRPVADGAVPVARVDKWLAEHMPDTPSKAEVLALVADNDRRLRQLANMGLRADAVSILNLRVQTLCDVLFGTEADPRRTTFEHHLGLRYREQIEALEAQARKAQLAQAGQPPSIILPGGNPYPNGPTNGHKRR